MVPAQPGPLPHAVRHAARAGVLQPSHRASAPDRLLRRAPSGLQLQHAGKEGTWRARASMPASSRFSRAASTRTNRRRAAGSRRGPTATPSAASPTKPTRACSTRSRGRTWIGPAIRCSIAPRPCSASSSTRRCTRRRCCTCGIACAFDEKRRPASYAPKTGGQAPRRRVDRHPARARHARRRSIGRAVRLGQRVPVARRRRAGFSIERHNVTNAAVRRVRRRRRIRRRALVEP